MEKTLAYFFVLWHMKNNREHFISVHTVIRQKMCKLEDLCLKTKEMDKKGSKEFFSLWKKEVALFFFNTAERSRSKRTIYSGPQGFLTVIV